MTVGDLVAQLCTDTQGTLERLSTKPAGSSTWRLAVGYDQIVYSVEQFMLSTEQAGLHLYQIFKHRTPHIESTDPLDALQALDRIAEYYGGELRTYGEQPASGTFIIDGGAVVFGGQMGVYTEFMNYVNGWSCPHTLPLKLRKSMPADEAFATLTLAMKNTPLSSS